jgi:hypothetical protein
MTGGYGNSYAQSVGQQAYQAQLENLNDIVPELYQMAYDKYNQEGQDLYNQYSMLGTQEEQDYGRHRDSVADWNAERDYLAGRYDSERDLDYSKYNNDRNFAYEQYGDDKSYAYQEHRNTIADEQWRKEFEEAQRQFNEQMALKESSSESGGDSESEGVTPPAKDPTPPKDPPPPRVPTYNSIVDDCNAYIAGGASRSEISNYIRSAWKSGYISKDEHDRLKETFVPTSHSGGIGGHYVY